MRQEFAKTEYMTKRKRKKFYNKNIKTKEKRLGFGV